MDNEVELVTDGDGLAIIGSPTAVERFMDSLNLPAADSVNLPAVLTAGSAIAQTAAGVADKSGRWVKLTAKSAKDIQQYGLTPTKTPLSLIHI